MYTSIYAYNNSYDGQGGPGPTLRRTGRASVRLHSSHLAYRIEFVCWRFLYDPYISQRPEIIIIDFTKKTENKNL